MLVYDASLAWPALLLLAIGLVMVYSASIAMAEATAHTGYRAWYFLVRHGVFVAVGARRGARRVPGADEGVAARSRRGSSSPASCCWSLVLMPGIGKSVNGSRRWLSLVVVNVQPSEFMKLAVVLYAASYAVRKAAFLHAEQPLRQTLVRGFLPLFAVMVAIGALLLLEPDFGAFVVIVAIAFGILFLGGLDWRLFSGLAAAAADRADRDAGRRAVPAAAAVGVPRSVVRSARQGLPAVALADRVRPRRMARRGTGRRASRSSSTCPRRIPISCSR